MGTKRQRALLASLGALGVIAMGAAPAEAEAVQSGPVVLSFDAAGAVFQCPAGDLTVTEGSIELRLHEVIDDAGVRHFRGRLQPLEHVLTDGDGGTYTLTGARTWSGTETSNGVTLYTSTDHFVIRSSEGGVYGMVNLVGHDSADGRMFTFDHGTCLPPE